MKAATTATTTSAGDAGSSLLRRGAGASGRITEQLLSSGGSMAAVGLVTALLTTGFVLWFVLELHQQSTVTAPLARTAAEMNASLNRSLGALRGWTAYGEERFTTSRRDIWRNSIEPSLGNLIEQSRASGDEETIANVAELAETLRELEFLQWKIEDIAQKPGNNPALADYLTRLRPLRDKLIKTLLGATDSLRRQAGSEGDTGFILTLLDFRSQIIIADWWLRDYLVQGDDYFGENARAMLQRVQERALEIEAGLEGLARDDHYGALSWAMDEFAGWFQRVQAAMTIRESTSGHMAKVYMQHEARPLLQRARELSTTLAESQAMAMENRTAMLSRASYAVTAMALLMGILAAGSLWFSFRLKGQVQNVLEKARKLGQYELDRQIGKGGMGEVYLAHHAMLRRPTAIKLLRALTAQNLKAQQRFQQEVKLACQLYHPNTVEIYDYGRTPAGIFYYAMEYLDGFCIDSMVQVAGPVPPARIVHLLTQICGSLAEAHALGFLHRDIKPSNIMVTRLGGVCDTPKVLDFGLALDLTHQHPDETDVIAGTPLYLAPEVILSSESYSPQSDLYALGALAYFMLCGEVIFPDSDVAELLAKQLDDPIPFPSERLGRPLPEDLECLVMACLSKDPTARPASAERLANMLAACDCPTWTAADARLWWDNYSEAACNLSRYEPTQGPSNTSAADSSSAAVRV